MSDYYLRANTKAAMQNAFLAAGITVQGIDGEMVDFDGIRLDIGWIGPVVRPDPADPEGPPIVDSRYHANLRVSGDLEPEVLAELPILDPPPTVPMRVWA
jgi:hypothetical protein